MTKKQQNKKVIREADIRFKRFWGKNERFADLFNTVVFHGRKEIVPEDLLEQDTNVSQLLELQDKTISLERTRDIMKVSKNGTRLLLLGVENQKEIHYGMPLKSLTYDVLGYINEANAIARKRKKEKTITSAEFLSGMKKGDKLTPIITLVIYYGEDPWDGPLSLQDMLRDMSAENIYHQTTHNITLLQVRNSDEFQFHNEEIETVFHVSRELFRGNTEGIREEYKNSEISEELISMVGCITGVHHITECGKEGERNMCRAIDEMLKKLEEETAKRVEEETAKRVEEETTKRVEEETTKRVEEETTKRVEEETAKRVEEEIRAALKKSLEELKISGEEIIDNLNAKLMLGKG